MQKFISIILLFALLSNTYSRCLVYAGYNLNKKYIASSLCENRKTPKLNCNGKCFLMKKIKQANKKENQNQQQLKKTNLYEALLSNNLMLKSPFAQNINLIFKNPTFSYPQQSNFIFQPPQA